MTLTVIDPCHECRAPVYHDGGNKVVFCTRPDCQEKKAAMDARNEQALAEYHVRKELSEALGIAPELLILKTYGPEL